MINHNIISTLLHEHLSTYMKHKMCRTKTFKSDYITIFSISQAKLFTIDQFCNNAQCITSEALSWESILTIIEQK